MCWVYSDVAFDSDSLKLEPLICFLSFPKVSEICKGTILKGLTLAFGHKFPAVLRIVTGRANDIVADLVTKFPGGRIQSAWDKYMFLLHNIGHHSFIGFELP